MRFPFFRWWNYCSGLIMLLNAGIIAAGITNIGVAICFLHLFIAAFTYVVGIVPNILIAIIITYIVYFTSIININIKYILVSDTTMSVTTNTVEAYTCSNPAIERQFTNLACMMIAGALEKVAVTITVGSIAAAAGVAIVMTAVNK